MAKKKKKKLKIRTSTKLLFIFILIIIFIISMDEKKRIVDFSKFKEFYKESIKVENNSKDKVYNECISNPLNDENFNEETIAKRDEILTYAKNNKIRYTYEDLTFGYKINYRENDSIYGASLIKLVVALYLVDNDIDLSTKVKYTSSDISDFSQEMSKKKVGVKVSLGDLMKYAITVSDNTAHHMLIKHIGKKKIKAYANSLGAKTIFTGSGDDFGNQSSYDMNIYLKRAYELFETKENGHLLKEYMSNNRRNSLNIGEDVKFAHKYGSVDSYFHDAGIYLGNNPYTISVLTTSGYTNGAKQINKISELTKQFSDLYHFNHENYCKELSQKKD